MAYRASVRPAGTIGPGVKMDSETRDVLLGEGVTNDKPANPDLMREAWLDIVKPVAMAGRLDHIPAKVPGNLREKSQGRKQAHYLSRRSFGMPEGYERIQWKKKS